MGEEYKLDLSYSPSWEPVLEPRRRLASEKRGVSGGRKPSGLSFNSKENPQFSMQTGIKRAQCRKLWQAGDSI